MTGFGHTIHGFGVIIPSAAAAGGPGLWVWGSNVAGRLGLGNTTAYSSPVQVGALTTWARVEGGMENSFGVKTDGTLWSWGYGRGGSLGHGNTTAYSSPKQIGSLTTWTTISAGDESGMAIYTDE